MLIVLTLPLLALVVMANNLSSGHHHRAASALSCCSCACKIKWLFILSMGAGGGSVHGFCRAHDRHGPGQRPGLLESYQSEPDPGVAESGGRILRTEGFQVLQGLYAIGSGGLLGKGLGESIQKLGFLPESQNDMIFAIICEELGLFGAVSVILIFLFMIYRFMLIAR